MHLKSRLSKWGLAAAVIGLVILLVCTLPDVIFAVRIALSLQKLASGATEQISGISEAKVRRRMGNRDYEALLYHPVQPPATSAIIMIPGLSELGCYHPRLVALAKTLSARGFMAICPDIREFREFQISPKPIDQVRFWLDEVPKLEGGERIRKIGFAGISFSGTLALMAAARPEMRDRVAFVIAIGPYSDLLRCTKLWFAAEPAATAHEYYPTRFYAKWIVMLSALDMLESERDKTFLRGVLNNLLLQKEVPHAPVDLTPEGARWYALAIMREDKADPELTQKIERHLVSSIYPQLDPEGSLKNMVCPSFLIHGEYDDLIPAAESEQLHQRISHSYLVISPFLTHTHPTDKPLSLGKKIGAAVDMIIFSYHFSRAAR